MNPNLHQAQNYKTITSGIDEYTVKRSRFIGYASRCTTTDEAAAFIESVRAQHREATVAYAYLLREGNIARYTDGGEPHGTAGMPILHVIQAQGLVDCCVVVIRYFGGIKLGAGGLIRAFGHGAVIALAACELVTYEMCQPYIVVADYSYHATVSAYLQPYAVRLDVEYGADVTYTVYVRTPFDITPEIIDMTHGSAIVEPGGQPEYIEIITKQQPNTETLTLDD